ncbi:MAG TPA: hypothetical protein VJ183_17590 [Chloroflexia bacterium]|nr:hypothetical protein [Chloroflexia bacterium]
MIGFFVAQAISLLVGTALFMAMGCRRLPTVLFAVAAWLGGTGVLAAQRLLLAQAGLPWTPVTLFLPWIIVGAFALLADYRSWVRMAGNIEYGASQPGAQWRQWLRSSLAPARARIGEAKSALLDNRAAGARRGLLIDLAVLVVIVGWVALFWWLTTRQLLAGWDAMTTWFLKGRVMYQLGTVPAGFFTDPLYVSYINPDYPPLVPLTIAHTYSFMGDHEMLMKGWWALLGGAALVGIYWGLAGIAGRAARVGGVLLVLGLPELLKHIAGEYTGYADLPLAVLFLFGTLFMYRWIKLRSPAEFRVAALFFCLAYLAKNEGLIIALAGLVLMAGLGARLRALSLPTIGWSVGLVALIVVPWQVERQVLGLVNSLQPDWAAAQADPVGRTATVLGGLFARAADPLHFNLMLPVLALLCVSALYFAPRQWLSTLPLFVAVGAHIGTAVLFYVATQYDLAWHLSTSSDRVLFQSALVVLLMSTIYLGMVLDGWKLEGEVALS